MEAGHEHLTGCAGTSLWIGKGERWSVGCSSLFSEGWLLSCSDESHATRQKSASESVSKCLFGLKQSSFCRIASSYPKAQAHFTSEVNPLNASWLKAKLRVAQIHVALPCGSGWFCWASWMIPNHSYGSTCRSFYFLLCFGCGFISLFLRCWGSIWHARLNSWENVPLSFQWAVYGLGPLVFNAAVNHLS